MFRTMSGVHLSASISAARAIGQYCPYVRMPAVSSRSAMMARAHFVLSHGLARVQRGHMRQHETGSGTRWGPLFGARAGTWAQTWEGPQGWGTPLYAHVLYHARLGPGTG